MSLLTVCQDAAVELNQPIPIAVASGASVFARELLLHANRSARAIMEFHDWRALTVLGTLTGNGSSTSFDLPDDYDRMPKKARLHSASWQNSSFRRADDLDQWLYLNDTAINGTPGNWIILGGQLQIYPAMPVTETARFYYISNAIVDPETGDNKSKFTADTDVYRLDERLLTLGIVWRWRAQKRLAFDIELRNYEIALSEAIGTDKGSRILTVGRQRMPAELAYNGVLGLPFGGSSFPEGGWDFSSNNEPTFDEE